jgi:hypothetical protein
MGPNAEKTLRAIAEAPPRVSYSRVIWAEFMKLSGLRKVNLHEYYLGSPSPDASTAEYQKIITELFEDAVAVGALILPPPYKTKDFLFQVGPSRNPTLADIGVMQVEAVLSSYPQVAQNVVLATHLNEVNTLSGGHVADALGFVANAVGRLVEARRA